MLDVFAPVTHGRRMTELQLTNARRRLALGILNVGFWVAVSIAGIFRVSRGGMAPVHTAGLLQILCVVVAVQSLFDFTGGIILMPPGGTAAPRQFPLRWIRGVLAHSSLLCLSGVLSYWSFRLWGGFSAAVLLSSAGLFFCRRHVLRLVAGVRARSSDFARCAGWGVGSTDPSFTGESCGIGRGAVILLPERWKTLLSASQMAIVVGRRLWQLENNLPARSLLSCLCWNLAGCQAGAFLLELPGRLPEQAMLLQYFWMTLWGFLGLLILPGISRSSVFAADRAAAARGLDVESWIQSFPNITGEDGNPGALVQRVFYPIPSAGERLSRLAASKHLPILGNVARTNLFLSLATLTILGRCVHCNVGRPELWVFPPSD